jgi:predicted transcriptional regulator
MPDSVPDSNKLIQLIRQFPVRLEEPMFEEVDRIAKQTNINKTTISRIAIQQFMDRLDSSGISNALEKVSAV